MAEVAEQPSPANSQRSLKRPAEEDLLGSASGIPPSETEPSSLSSMANKKVKLEQEGDTDAEDEGEIVEDVSVRGDGATHKPDIPDKVPRSGWNRGVSQGLRTSFGSSFLSLASQTAKASAPPAAAEAEEETSTVVAKQETQSEDKSDEDDDDDEARPADEELAGPDDLTAPAPSSKQNWVLPDLGKLPALDGKRKKKAWQRLFSAWLKKFIRLNKSLRHLLDADTCLETYNAQMAKGPASKAQRQWARKGALEFTKSGKLAGMIGTAPPGESSKAASQQKTKAGAEDKLPPSAEEAARSVGAQGSGLELMPQDEISEGEVLETPKEEKQELLRAEELASLLEQGGERRAAGANEEDEEGEDEEEDDAEEMSEVVQRRKYFPGVSDDELFCVMCASYGHRAAECPLLTCRFCRNDEHPSFNCPTRQRCTKCKQLGHRKEACKEKLAVAQGEEYECAICQAPDHDETVCDELWRSYYPSRDSAKKVRDIAAFCYRCGARGHYGTACGLAQALPLNSVHETWSMTNLERFLDPQSESVAIESAAAETVNGSAWNGGRPNLGGRSIVPQRHVVFEESDGEDDGFIRPPVQRPAPPGHINMSQNLPPQPRNGYRPPAPRSGARNNQAWQPPLPPGPPPASLPPRPGFPPRAGADQTFFANQQSAQPTQPSQNGGSGKRNRGKHPPRGPTGRRGGRRGQSGQSR